MKRINECPFQYGVRHHVELLARLRENRANASGGELRHTITAAQDKDRILVGRGDGQSLLILPPQERSW